MPISTIIHIALSYPMKHQLSILAWFALSASVAFASPLAFRQGNISSVSMKWYSPNIHKLPSYLLSFLNETYLDFTKVVDHLLAPREGCALATLGKCYDAFPTDGGQPDNLVQVRRAKFAIFFKNITAQLK